MKLESVKDATKHLSQTQKAELLEWLKKEVYAYHVRGKKMVSEYGLPISVFKHGLSGLETVCVYLKQEGLRFSQIAEMLNRSPVTVRLSYRNGKQKFKGDLDVSDKEIMIPVELFKERKRSVLRHVVAYLKDEKNISIKEIAVLLNRDYKTVWSAYAKR